MSETQRNSHPENRPAKSSATVLAEIQQLEKAGKVSTLRNYLTQLAKEGDKPAQYESVFRKYLASPEADLREAAVFCLLFALQIQNEEYRQSALQQLLETDKEDFDARHWAAASLAMAYRTTKDRELTRVFFTILDDEEEDPALRGAIVGSILLVHGQASREKIRRVDSFTAPLKIILAEFEVELLTARQPTKS